jgi:CubicO group peptidase (beta-lactamase class C family)
MTAVRRTVLVVAGLAGAVAGHAQQPVDSARALVRAYLEGQHVPGASVAVSRMGRVVWSEAFGHADLEHRVRATPETRFRIGSISKALTSIALATLAEQGTLDLDAPVQRYAPTFPEKEWPITSRQLAGHLSGLPHYTREDIVNTVRYQSVTDALRKFQDRPLLFRPGERYAYSSFGWNLLAVVVEGASGEEFLPFMQREVFEPLGMARTIADHYDDIVADRTAFYIVKPDGTPINAPAVDNSDVWAGGGFLSTAIDLVRFADGVLAGTVLDSAGRALLFTSMTTSDGKPTGYGLGWTVREEDGRAWVGHGGSHVGASAQLLAAPDRRLVVAILTNSNNRGLGDLARQVALRFDEPNARPRRARGRLPRRRAPAPPPGPGPAPRRARPA